VIVCGVAKACAVSKRMVLAAPGSLRLALALAQEMAARNVPAEPSSAVEVTR